MTRNPDIFPPDRLSSWAQPTVAPPPFAPAGCLLAAARGQTVCRDRLKGLVGRNREYLADWVDPDTPDAACTLDICTGDYATCNPANGATPKTNMALVFSDEFGKEGRDFSVGAGDPKWTAQDMYYYPTRDLEIYKPEQVTTKGEWYHLPSACPARQQIYLRSRRAHARTARARVLHGHSLTPSLPPPPSAPSHTHTGGFAVITMEEGVTDSFTQQPDGELLGWDSAYKSGFVHGWNKFCFTGRWVDGKMMLQAVRRLREYAPANANR